MRCIHISLLLIIAPFANAQEQPQKIGHADWEYIFSNMPEYKLIEAELKTFEAQLQNQLKQKNQELETKYKAYLAMPETTPDAIKNDKESELTYLQGNIQKFQQEAQQAMQKKQEELVTPVFKKIGKAIEEVAAENGYAYIINPQGMGGNDILLYSNEAYNISKLVLKKIGIIPK